MRPAARPAAARAARLLHGRPAGAGAGAAPAGRPRRPRAAGDALGFPRRAAGARLAGAAERGGDRRRARGGLPVELIQTLFAGIDPLAVPRKFARFAELDPRSPDARIFVAVEDWLNDGVALGAEVARECLLGWYLENRPARGAWQVGGQAVRPERLSLPALVAIPTRDRIVPPASAAALAARLPGAGVLEPEGGHIGMIVAGSARRRLWAPLVAWLQRIAAMQK